MPFHRPLVAILAGLALAQAATATAQSPAANQAPAPPCLTAADKGDVRAAAASGEADAASIRARLATAPNDVASIVTLARIISQCQIPAAELTQQGELSAEAIDLLKRALELEPTNWLARYLVAQNYFRAPSFLRRADAAARELDALIAQQGDRAEPAIFARPFELRGLLWLRAGERDSARALWSRGLRIFPSDSGLVQRLRGLGAASAPLSPSPSTDSSSGAALHAVVVRAPRTVVRPAVAPARAVQRMDVLMSPGAAADVLQALQLQGGATMTGAGADLHARAGDPSETPLFVNGVPMIGGMRFETFDGALFGALDPQVLRETRFSPGGFSAEFGNALSGVVEAETEGRAREHQLRLGLSSVTASATARTPIGATAGVWGSARASNTAAMLWMNGRANEYRRSPMSIDAIGGYTLAPSPLSELRFVALLAGDDASRDASRADYSGPYEARGASAFLGASGRRVSPSTPIIETLSMGVSGRRSGQRFGVLDRTRNDGVASLRGSVEWIAAPSMRVRGGIDGEAFTRGENGVVPSTAGLAPGSPAMALNVSHATTHAGAWTDAAWNRGAVSLVAGTRADRLPGETAITIDPRFNATLAMGKTNAHAAVGVFHQGAWRPLPDQPSIVGLADVPTRATHVTIGLERASAGEWAWRVDAFDKAYGRYASRGGLPLAGGRVRGVEALVRRPAAAGRRVDGWLVYAATRSRVTLGSGGEMPGAFDVTHALTLATTWRPSDQWRIGTTIRAATGLPTTDVTGGDSTSSGVWQPRYGAANASRLPGYRRADLRVTRFLATPRGMAALFLEAINTLDRHNVAGWSYDAAWRARTPVSQFFGRRTLVFGADMQLR